MGRRIFNAAVKALITLGMPIFLLLGLGRAARHFWRELRYEFGGLGREYFDQMMDGDPWAEWQRAKRLAAWEKAQRISRG